MTHTAFTFSKMGTLEYESEVEKTVSLVELTMYNDYFISFSF